MADARSFSGAVVPTRKAATAQAAQIAFTRPNGAVRRHRVEGGIDAVALLREAPFPAVSHHAPPATKSRKEDEHEH
jgi:hypothetical protein